MEIDERKQQILWAIVKEYIDEAEPVGSTVICKKYHLDISPATVRNEMSNLEEAGYLTHPHTSAGRIPTDKGYRFFVDHLMKIYQLSTREKTLIKQAYLDLNNDMENIMEHTLKAMITLSNYPSVITENPDIFKDLFGEMQRIMQKRTQEKFYFSGLSRLLNEPEFVDINKIKSLLNVFEDKDRACLLLDSEEDSENVVIRIGEENKCEELKDCSIITRKFHYENKPIGTIGIVGPKRMRYAQATSTIDHIAQNLEDILASI